MKKQHAQEIINCLPGGRTPFHYHKDRYAVWLLANRANQGCSIRELKQSSYARLLNKPLIKDMLAQQGHAELNSEDFAYLWLEPSVTFMLTLDIWGGMWQGYYQTTRPGYNLVLQLNFSNQHNHFFHKQIDDDWQDDLRSYSHPTLLPGERRNEYETLAWSRMDIDLDKGEALIEEIQNDWLRLAKRWQRCANKSYACEDCPLLKQRHRIDHYLKHILKPYHTIWSEAMLAATLWFLNAELGINKVFYHTDKSGHRLKCISGKKPPRSIYSDLPRQFCFSPTKEAPEFLLQDRNFKRSHRRKRLTQALWQKLELEKNHAWA